MLILRISHWCVAVEPWSFKHHHGYWIRFLWLVLRRYLTLIVYYIYDYFYIFLIVISHIVCMLSFVLLPVISYAIPQHWETTSYLIHHIVNAADLLQQEMQCNIIGLERRILFYLSSACVTLFRHSQLLLQNHRLLRVFLSSLKS